MSVIVVGYKKPTDCMRCPLKLHLEGKKLIKGVWNGEWYADCRGDLIGNNYSGYREAGVRGDCPIWEINAKGEAKIPKDVKPVVHGYWIYNTDDILPAYRCSQCNYNDKVVERLNEKPPRRNFCPNCGADMRNGNESFYEL